MMPFVGMLAYATPAVAINVATSMIAVPLLIRTYLDLFFNMSRSDSWPGVVVEDVDGAGAASPERDRARGRDLVQHHREEAVELRERIRGRVDEHVEEQRALWDRDRAAQR